MKIFDAILIVCIATVNAACTENTSSRAKKNQDSLPGSTPPQITKDAQLDIPSLLQEIDQANDKCRGLAGDSKEGTEACEKRDRLMKEAEKRDWCWGPQGAYGYEQHWIHCSDDPARMPKRQWFAHDINHARCIKSLSPADKIREIQDFGQIVRTNDLAAGAVEVEVNIGNGKSQVWSYYPSAESCEATLPKSQKIDEKYE